jgi:hypothetical protein
MDDVMSVLKAQLEAQNEMYKAGYLAGLQEGKRIALQAIEKGMERAEDKE